MIPIGLLIFHKFKTRDLMLQLLAKLKLHQNIFKCDFNNTFITTCINYHISKVLEYSKLLVWSLNPNSLCPIAEE